MNLEDRNTRRTDGPLGTIRLRTALCILSTLLVMLIGLPALAQTSLDRDGDGHEDTVDNCHQLANPTQRDTDGDGFGDHCDADFNNDGLVSTRDFGDYFFPAFTAGVDGGNGADMNGDGIVSMIDFGLFFAQFSAGAPGPGVFHPAFLEKGWVPTTDGPRWAHYEVDGDVVRWEEDIFFDLAELREYQATVYERPPIEITSYDIDNGTYQYDDTYRGGTGDGGVATRVYPSFELSTLAGGRGKLADGAYPDSVTHRQLRDAMAVTWGDWTGHFQVSPMTFRLEEHAEIGSVVIRGMSVGEVELTIGDTTISRTFSPTGDLEAFEIDADGGLGLSGDQVIIHLPSGAGTFYEVEVYGMPPQRPTDVAVEDGVTVDPDARRAWRDGDVPYELIGFDACPPDESCATSDLMDAIDHWDANTTYSFREDAEASTRIRFRLCTSTDTAPYCRQATEREMCLSVGAGRPRGGGVRDVYFKPGGCGYGTAIHEIGHALGLYHEQAHRDRDAFIDVNWENIQDDDLALAQYRYKGTSFGDYNYRSIMHYSVKGFGKKLCCSVDAIDSSQDGVLPASCEYFEDVKITTHDYRNGDYVERDRCPAAERGDTLDLPHLHAMQTMVPDPGLPISRPDVKVGQRRELSKGDITAANALVLGDYGARSYHSLSDVALVDFAPGASAYALGDVNADGLDDLIAFSNHIYVALGQPDGTVVDDGIWFADVYCHSERQCVVGDPDGDGRDDVVSFHENGQVEVFWSNGEDAFYRFIGAEVSHYTFGRRAQYGSAFFLADVDGDCVDDAVAIDTPQYLGAMTIRVAISTGGKLSAFDVVENDWLTFSVPLGGARGWSFGDVDLDGKDDFQAGRTIYLSNGNGFDAGEDWAPTGYWPQGWCSSGQCQLADVDDDGRADLVEMYESGVTSQERLRYALSTGRDFAAHVPNYHEIDCRNEAGCLLGDVDGDGWMDSVDAVRVQLYGNDEPGREPGSIWISRARELWTNDIGPRSGGGFLSGNIMNQCGNPFPLPTL